MPPLHPFIHVKMRDLENKIKSNESPNRNGLIVIEGLDKREPRLTLLGQDFGALNATRCEKRRDHMTHKADAILKFFVRCRPHGFKPNGESHS